MFLQKLNSLIEQNNITKNKLLTDLKLGKNSFVNWEQRGTIPNGETLSQIADYFNVSVDYLLGKEERSTTLTKQEQFLLDGFRSLNSVGQEYILQTLELTKATYKKSDTASDSETMVG